jgi:hypothetical protein
LFPTQDELKLVKKTIEFNPNIPPPEELVQKSSVAAEEAQSGAQIAFLKLQRLMGAERLERLNAENANRNCPWNRDSDVRLDTSISDYIVNCAQAGKIVYCRLGEKYIQDLEKKKNSGIPNVPASGNTASYLINIKKLIEMHNL